MIIFKDTRKPFVGFASGYQWAYENIVEYRCIERVVDLIDGSLINQCLRRPIKSCETRLIKEEFVMALDLTIISNEKQATFNPKDSTSSSSSLSSLKPQQIFNQSLSAQCSHNSCVGSALSFSSALSLR